MTQAVQNPLGEAEKRMFAACMEQNLPMLKEALDNGADIFAHQPEGALDSGKNAMYLCARRGFVEGMVLLRAQGLDVDYRDSKVGNTALHLLPNVGDVAMFRVCIEMGADVEATNNRGFNVKEGALHIDKMHGKDRFGQVLAHFESLPARQDFAGLTLDEVLERNAQGFCMLDNPRMLARIGEMGEALQASGTPLTLEALKTTSADGRSYLVKLMIADRLHDAVAVLNANGEQVQHETLFAQDKSLSEIGEQMTQWRQIAALFTMENWKGTGAAAMMDAVSHLPEEASEQLFGIHQLRAALQSQSTKGVGRYGL